MKTETLLLIGAAVGVGYLIAKKRATPSATPGVAPQQKAVALPEENAEVIFVEPAVEYVPYPVWGGPWGGSWRGGWGGRRHHGGHHHRRR